MKWIYLSPHFDDAVLSCGGLIWKQVQVGDEVEVWTIFGGDPPEDQRLSMFAQVLHYRWEIPEDSVEVRRKEDKKALSYLGASARHFNFMDCIYRTDKESGDFLYEDMGKITDPEGKKENELIEKIRSELGELKDVDAQVVSPFGVGNHVDHRAIREISSELRIDIMYYLDFPYVFIGKDSANDTRLGEMQYEIHGLDEVSIQKWIEAVSFYESQISSLCASMSGMKGSIKEYYQKMGGIKIFY